MDLAVEALAQVPEARLDVVGAGGGGRMEDLRALAEKLGGADRVHFHGVASDKKLDSFYNNATIFVLPSLYEGYGMVFAEAISRGLPVISTTAGAIPHTVPKGCGILVSPADTDELKKALGSLIVNTELRDKYRQATIKAADTFPTWQESALKFAQLLEKFV